MIASFNSGEERQEGMGNSIASPQAETSPETTGGEQPSREESTFPPAEAFKEPMLSWYRNHPDLYELDRIRVEEIMPKKRRDVK